MRHLFAAAAGVLLALALLIGTPALAFPGSMNASDGDSLAGDVVFGSGVSWSFVTINSVDTLDGTQYVVSLDASGGDFALTLPAASTTSGRAYVLIMAGASGTVTLTPDGADTIEGAATLALDTQFTVFDVYSDGVSDWAVQAEGGGFSGDLNSNDLTDSSDSLVTIAESTEIGSAGAVERLKTFGTVVFSDAGDLQFKPQFIATTSGANTPTIEVFGGFFPLGGNQHDFGKSSGVWKTGFFNTIDATLSVQPRADGVGTLGTTTKTWASMDVQSWSNSNGTPTIPDADGLLLSAGTLQLGTGEVISNVADGGTAYSLDTLNSLATGTLFVLKENGANVLHINAAGTGVFTGIWTVTNELRAQHVITNPSGSNGCTGGGALGHICLDEPTMVDGVVWGEEQADAPATLGDYGGTWWEADNSYRGMDGDGEEHIIHGFPTMQSWSFSNIGSGTHCLAGDYEAPAAEMVLSDSNLSQTIGEADDDEPWGGHAFVVHKGDGATDGSDLVLTVSGSSITDAGVYVASDSEVILADALLATAATDGYVETAKKWVGQVTFTLSSSGGTTFNYSGNYGLSAYTDSFDNDFAITGFKCRGQAGNSTNIDIELLHHPADGSGWTYSAADFLTTIGNEALVKMSDEYEGGETNITAGKNFNFKRLGFSQFISGSTSGGYLIRVTTGANNAIDFMTCSVGVEF